MLSPIRRFSSARLVHRLCVSHRAYEPRRYLSKCTFGQRNAVARIPSGLVLKARQQLRYSSTNPVPQLPTKVEPNYLPVTCPGCGAYTQWVVPGEAGYYDLKRSLVKDYIRDCQRRKILADPETIQPQEMNGSEGESSAVEPLNDDSNLAQMNTGIEAEGNGTPSESSSTEKDISSGESSPETGKDSTQHATPSAEIITNENKPDSLEGGSQSVKRSKKGRIQQTETDSKPAPRCDRCNQLVNHNKGEPIPYPPLSYIADLIEESPFRDNHIYHIIDAADFPLSLIPGLERELPLAALRSKNRRSTTAKYSSGDKLAELHFIITRADLVARDKETADSYMAPMKTMLREALGTRGSKVRLGNVHMVSTNRGWWTKDVKEKIWEHGGGVWLVGKANVGKSKLISSIFPKSAPAGGIKVEHRKGVTIVGRSNQKVTQKGWRDSDVSGDSLLPPARQETQRPDFPIDSTRSGTTASPIRLPFDNHRGEIIDLPGLHRTGLDEYVRPELQSETVMTKFAKPKQLTLGPTQSLILGGLVRVTPLTDDLFITIPFVPLEVHQTSTLKAQEKYQGNAKLPTRDVSTENAHEHMKSAGIFELNWDVSDRYDPSRKRIRNGIELFKVFGIDILIEGVGWVEVHTQIRTRHRASDDYPKIEIFSPGGKFIGSRKPLCAWRDVSRGKPNKGGSARKPSPFQLS